MAVTGLRVVFAGTPQVAVPALRAVIDSPHHVVGVLTRPDAPSGRGRRMQPSAVAQVAHELDLPLARPATMSEPTVDSLLAEWAPDVVVVVAYGLLIPPRLLALPRHGWVNAHFSALPRWRGAAPVQYAIAHGDPTIAVSAFRIEEGLDTGPLVGQSEPIRIADREDAGHLLARLSDVAAALLTETLDGLSAGTAHETPQALEGVTYAPRIVADDARINWYQPVDDVDRWIRACTPAPGAWTNVEGARIGIGTPIAVHHGGAGEPGQITAEKNRVLVSATGGHIELGSVRPMGKREMAAADWARGFRGNVPREFRT